MGENSAFTLAKARDKYSMCKQFRLCDLDLKTMERIIQLVRERENGDGICHVIEWQSLLGNVYLVQTEIEFMHAQSRSLMIFHVKSSI